MITGIYKITNISNSKCYIGSSVDITKRQYQHMSDFKLNKHHNKHLQNAWNKYGKENFVFEIIEECSRDFLLEKEQFYITKFNPEYNKCLIVLGSPLGVKRTEETKQRMSIARMGREVSSETRQKISKANFGKHRTEETRKKLSELRKVKKRGPYKKRKS